MQTTKPKQRTKYNAQAKNIALPWTVLVILVLAVGFGFGVGTLPFQTASANKTFFCTPNGIVHLPWKSADSYNQCWDPALFLSITLAFGRLSFTAAKAIDVIWDLFVGRGGQVLLGWVTYTIVRRSLVTAMESEPMPLPVFASTSFDKLSYTSIWSILSEGFTSTQAPSEHSRSRRWRSTGKRRLASFVLASIYVLAFPTILSAMSGYQAALDPYVRQQGTGDLTPMTNLTLPDFFIVDGGRVGIGDHAPVYGDSPFWSYAANGIELEKQVNAGRFENASSSQTVSFGTAAAFYIPAHAKNLSNIRSAVFPFRGSTIEIPAPPLTISYVQPDTWYNGQSNFSQGWIETNSFCLPSNTYQWGFSSLFFFCFALLTVLFVFLLALLQWDIHWHSRMDRAEPWRSNAYRDALDLVRAMQTQLPGELAVMEPSELEKEVKRCHGTIGLGSEALPPSRGQERTTAEDRKGRHHQNGRLLKTSHDENGEELTEVLVGLESIRPVKSGTSNLVYYR